MLKLELLQLIKLVTFWNVLKCNSLLPQLRSDRSSCSKNLNYKKFSDKKNREFFAQGQDSNTPHQIFYDRG